MTAEAEPVSPLAPRPMIYSIVPFPKNRDQVGEPTCACFTFLTLVSPAEEEEKESVSVEEPQTPATKVRNATSLHF